MAMWKLTIILLLSLFVLETEPAKCCLKFRLKPVRCDRLVGYTVQKSTGRCDISAIVFHTKDKKFICADPEVIWTQNRTSCLIERGAEMVRPGVYLLPGYGK